MAIIKKQSMSAQVIDHILNQIETGELKPGDKLLNERDFAEQLGISRVPLREAMCALTALGILTSRQGDGTFVNRFNDGMLGRILYIYTILDEISAGDLMELRTSLEAGTASSAAQRRSEEELKAIKAAKEDFARAYESLQKKEGSVQDVLRADHAFHQAIGEAAGNRLYQEFLDALRTPFMHYDFEESQEKSLKNFKKSLGFHDKITAAIEKQDAANAYQLMEAHIQEVSANIRK